MRTVLLVSRHFPPAYDVGGKRAYRWARYLPEHGWRPVVWTSPPPAQRSLDPTPLKLPAQVRVVRGYRTRAGPSRGSDGTDPRPTVLSQRRRLYAPLVDRELWSALRQAPGLARLARSQKAEVILATGGPYSTLVLGAVAAWMAKLPLCLDLRDPWTLNPLHRYKPFWVRKVDEWLERRLFRRAGRVLTTCEDCTRAYRDRYPDLPLNRWFTLHNAFDPEQRPTKRSIPGPVRLVHFGNCYGSRSLEPVLRAIHGLRRKRKLEPEQLELLNLGRVAQSDLTLARELGLERFFKYRTMVPYEEGLALLAGCDLQLLFSYDEEELFLPAKFYDYLLSGSPILCVAVPSELTRLVRECRAGTSCHPRDQEGLITVLEQALEASSKGTPLADPDPLQVERFSAACTAASLARELDQLADR